VNYFWLKPDLQSAKLRSRALQSFEREGAEYDAMISKFQTLSRCRPGDIVLGEGIKRPKANRQ
jgi:hypothetical protein